MFLSCLISVIFYWLYKTRIRQSKINLGLFYLTITSLIFIISFFSCVFVSFTDIEFPNTYHYCQLSYPLELTVSISPLLIYPPFMTVKLDIFGIELLKVTGQGRILLERFTLFIIEGATFFSVIIFLINVTFVLICLLLIAILFKKVPKLLKKLPIEQVGHSLDSTLFS
jgi:hypothetical protein